MPSASAYGDSSTTPIRCSRWCGGWPGGAGTTLPPAGRAALGERREGILGYLRELDGDTLLVLLNFEAQAGGLNHRDLPERATLELCTHRNREPETVTLSDLQLRPNEGLLLRPLVG